MNSEFTPKEIAKYVKFLLDTIIRTDKLSAFPDFRLDVRKGTYRKEINFSTVDGVGTIFYVPHRIESDPVIECSDTELYNVMFIPNVTEYNAYLVTDDGTVSRPTIQVQDYSTEEARFQMSCTDVCQPVLEGMDIIVELSSLGVDTPLRLYYENTIEFLKENHETLDMIM